MEVKFKCKKCLHTVFTDTEGKFMRKPVDCPKCGEEPDENWIYLGPGNWEKEKDNYRIIKC